MRRRERLRRSCFVLWQVLMTAVVMHSARGLLTIAGRVGKSLEMSSNSLDFEQLMKLLV